MVYNVLLPLYNNSVSIYTPLSFVCFLHPFVFLGRAYIIFRNSINVGMFLATILFLWFSLKVSG